MNNSILSIALISEISVSIRLVLVVNYLNLGAVYA